jgi:hypothetical protein
MVQIVRSKLTQYFFHLRSIFIVIVHKISAADMLSESAEMFPQLGVYFSDLCHCTYVAAVCLVVGSIHRMVTKTAGFILT